jgi:hypothetical protein
MGEVLLFQERKMHEVHIDVTTPYMKAIAHIAIWKKRKSPADGAYMY